MWEGTELPVGMEFVHMIKFVNLKSCKLLRDSYFHNLDICARGLYMVSSIYFVQHNMQHVPFTNGSA